MRGLYSERIRSPHGLPEPPTASRFLPHFCRYRGFGLYHFPMNAHEADHGRREIPKPWDAQIRTWLRNLSDAEQRTLIAQWILRHRRDAQNKLESLFHVEALQQFSTKVHALALQLDGEFKRDEQILWGQLYVYISAIPKRVRKEMLRRVKAVLAEHSTAQE